MGPSRHWGWDRTAALSLLAPWGKVVPAPTDPRTVLKELECAFLFRHPQNPHHLHSTLGVSNRKAHSQQDLLVYSARGAQF